MNMKRILFCLIFLASASFASAQIVSPTINYQGRAQDADGNALTGNHQITLRIYNAVTGGTALFSETHGTISFSDAGIFTVVIGGATQGGIPPTVGFDQPRWIGVTISGFNSGNELPRLRFLGSPYSFVSNRAFFADSSRATNRADRAANAGFADSAVAADRAVKAVEAQSADKATIADALSVPALLENVDKGTALLVRNEDTSPALLVEGGLEVQGDRYAIISQGIDSTAQHYTAGEVAGNTGIPDAGSLYRDNTPIAWGQVELDGSLLTDFGIARVNHTPNNPGVYVVVLDNPVLATAQNTPQFSVAITPHMQAGSVSAPLVFANWDYAPDGTGGFRTDAFIVYMRGFEAGQDNRFSVVVFGRPAK